VQEEQEMKEAMTQLKEQPEEMVFTMPQVTEVEAAEVPDKLVVMVDLEEEVLEEMDQQIQ
tara:strand:+ start:252 stop:431 length:180 start_codon:yes stop_codon:yes gene_type:complete